MSWLAVAGVLSKTVNVKLEVVTIHLQSLLPVAMHIAKDSVYRHLDFQTSDQIIST